MPNGNYTIKNENGSLQYVDHAQAWKNVTDAMSFADGSEQKQKLMSDYLQGIRGEIDTSRMAEENLGAYSKNCKDVYSTAERKKQISKRGTQLWQKNKNAYAIEKQEESRREKMRSRAEKAMRNGHFNYSINSPGLVALSAFMRGSVGSDTSLISTYAAGKKNLVLNDCIREFMALDLDRLDLKSDKKTAENAEALEKLSERFSAIQ